MTSEWAEDPLADGEFVAAQGRGLSALGALANALGSFVLLVGMLCFPFHLFAVCVLGLLGLALGALVYRRVRALRAQRGSDARAANGVQAVAVLNIIWGVLLVLGSVAVLSSVFCLVGAWVTNEFSG